MNKLRMKQLAALCIATTLTLNSVSSSAAVLTIGSRNNEVKKIQTTLKQLGYFKNSKVTGYYGNITAEAVRKFQRKYGLVADGIVGNRTKAALTKYTPKVKSAVMVKETTKNQDAAKKAKTKEKKDSSDASSNQDENKIKVLTSDNAKEEIKKTTTVDKKEVKTHSGAFDWFKEVKYIYKRGMEATITDVKTGKSFKVERTYGTNHADVEPLTKKDTEIIKDIWGGFSWERRAVIVTVGNNIIAGSMTAMPHAGVESQPANIVVNNRSDNYGRGDNLDAVKGNGVSGVMDLHFLNSRTHSSNVKQKSHQDMVKKALDYIKNNDL
jgi:peptidoglycan hydrolase-like protein with peptidoglycan-binding domain